MKPAREYIHAGWASLHLNKVQVTIVLAGVYILFSLVGNIAATKVTYLGSLIMDAGFIYCLTFTWRDLIHKQLGKKAALTTIFLSGIINLIAAVYFQLVVALPAETSWAAAGGQAAWAFLFGIQFRIVVGSIVAMVVSELVDTQTYQWWSTGFGKDKPQWMRVVVSNVISTPVDSILFPLIAFTGIVGPGVMVQMFITNILVKFIMTAVSWWMIYLVPEKPIYVEE